jgi:hypothetical protein
MEEKSCAPADRLVYSHKQVFIYPAVVPCLLPLGEVSQGVVHAPHMIE